MINMIIIDSLEHRWAVQLGLTADGGHLARPNAIFFRSHSDCPWVVRNDPYPGGVDFGESKMKNSEMKISKSSNCPNLFVRLEYNPSGLETARTRL